mmetsp:Transcript_31771/g.46857  ORF Transcript_31771/g.46857 Transcript_31771/m.46857 type:complete len:434 (+) Transcript_31771:43-1344(+)
MVKVSSSRTALRRKKTKASFLIPCLVVFGVITTSVLFLTAHVSSNLQPASYLAPSNLKKTSSADLSRKKENKATIGYAVSITGCGSDPLSEGAAVLKHSIHQASEKGSYDYKMYAIVHPNGEECGSQLSNLGYTVLIRETPVAVKDIKGDFLREKIESNGCCGEKELIKLEAYTIVQHPIVVHLDLDTLVLKPMDDLFDYMLGKTSDLSKLPVMWQENPLPKEVNALFTRDYNMVHASTKYKPVQGGFLVLRPSMDTYKEFCDIVQEGDFRNGKGWGGVVGPFYGSMTFQGIIPYYYDYLHPDTALELNRCIYNQMCDNPRDQRTIDDVVHGKCRTGELDCEDCRSRPLEDVVTSHFTLCQKPWWCLPQSGERIQERLCRKLHGQWYRIRSDLEASWGRSGEGPGTFDKEQFKGYCNRHGKGGYIPIEKPYGR